MKPEEIAELLKLVNKTDKAEFGDGSQAIKEGVMKLIVSVGDLNLAREEIEALKATKAVAPDGPVPLPTAEELAKHPETTLAAARRAVAAQQQAKLSMLAAAFNVEVGSKHASKFELVQLQAENIIRWYFRRRKR